MGKADARHDKDSGRPDAAGDGTGDGTGEKAAGEKLQKVLARLGLGSRREMEKWIEQGRVHIDGRKARLGDRVIEGQRLELDGRKLVGKAREGTRCLLYNKPTAEVCSRKDPEGRRTVFESLPRVKDGRWISIGRLDYNTSGLLLFTTDGELANALMHPGTNIDREYLVRVKGDVDDTQLQAMLDGVLLEDGMARFTDIQPGRGEEDSNNRWFYVVLMEGRNREVRRLWESQGLTVSRLKRVRYGEVFMPSSLKKGQCMELDKREVEKLYSMAGLPAKPVIAQTPDELRQAGRRRGKSSSDAEKASKRRAGPKGAQKSERKGGAAKSASGRKHGKGKPAGSDWPDAGRKSSAGKRGGKQAGKNGRQGGKGGADR